MKFKSITRMLTALLVPMSIALWMPQAQAIPAFALQTGMPCNACHYQHFPVLNSFGRAFKEGGFTMIGSQGKVEGDLGLSIPVVLNGSIVVHSTYQKTNGPDGGTTATGKGTNNGQLNILSGSGIFFGGRVSENIGFESEVTIYPAPDTGVLNYKMPIIYDADSAKIGVVPFSTKVYGPSFGLEVMNTSAVHLFNQDDMPAISAQQYINTGTVAQGVSLVASNNMGSVSFAKWMPDQLSSSGSPSSNYFRIAATPGNLIPGFDFGVGAQFWSGTSASTNTTEAGGFLSNPVGGTSPVAGVYETKASAVDAQLMGEVGGMPLTVVVSYATAPSSGAPTGVIGGFQGNLYNPGTETRKSFNMGAELGVIPQKMSLQAGLRRASSGFALGTISNASDNALLFGATYALSLNIRMDLTYSKYSGDMYSAASATAQGAGYTGDRMTQLVLVGAF